MSAFLLNISSPDGKVFSGNVEFMSVRGVAGDLAVMAGHVPFITSVKAGECQIMLEDGTERPAQLGGGLLTVDKDSVTLLTASFAWA